MSKQIEKKGLDLAYELGFYDGIKQGRAEVLISVIDYIKYECCADDKRK